MRKLIIVLCLLLPVTTFAYTRDKSHVKKSAEVNAIEVYHNNTAPQPFVVIGSIHAKGSTEKTLIRKIKNIARKMGADAVLNYKIEPGTHPSYWTGAVLSNARGIAVKWSNPGIMTITESTPIPVIQ